MPSILCPKINKLIAHNDKIIPYNIDVFWFIKYAIIKYIPVMYKGNPIQCNVILIGCLCVFLIALSKLNFNI